MIIPINTLCFYLFSSLAIFSSLMVVFSKNTVRSALYLVLTFVASAAIWMLLEAEFLSLVLIVVYVGAVMTLLLFVVMMLNLDTISEREGLAPFVPVKILTTAFFTLILMATISQVARILSHSPMALVPKPENYSNIQTLGRVLYTDYVYAFEIAGVILLTAIIAAITLAFRGPQKRLSQSISSQVNTKPSDRVYIVDMPSEKKTILSKDKPE